jgi:hypothetical protein
MNVQASTKLDSRRLLLFAAFAAAAFSVEWAITRTAALHRSSMVPIAVLVDLVVVVPLVFAAAVLRPARRSLLEIAPVVAIGAVLANLLLAARVDTVASRVAGVAAELMVIALLVRRVRRAASQLRGAGESDLLLRIESITDPMLRVAGAEVMVLYFAIVGPWLSPPRRVGEFSYASKSGLVGMLFALGLLIATEGLGVHLLVHAWSSRAAWVHAALNAYSLVWLVAVYQAARLRPIVVSADGLLVRASLLWTAEVTLANVASVTAIDESPRGKGVLRAALGTAPVLLVTLIEPVVARGPLGIRRSVRLIALYVDEPAALRATIESLSSRRNA